MANAKKEAPENVVEGAAVPIEEKPKGKYVVLQQFHDVADFSKVYKVDDIITLEGTRATELSEAGLVKAK